MDFRIDMDNLTMGHLEWLCEFAESTLNEIQVGFETSTFTMKQLMGLMALADSPDDPQAGLEVVRKIPITQFGDVELVYEDDSTMDRKSTPASS